MAGDYGALEVLSSETLQLHGCAEMLKCVTGPGKLEIRACGNVSVDKYEVNLSK